MSDSRHRSDLHAHFCESCDGCYPCQGTLVKTVCQSAAPCVECKAAPDPARVIAVRAANA